jgi:diadenosine tetraphosphate (Ap4A) HIT family hydrolase
VRRDNFPATDGHVEIVPKRHVVSFFDLTRRELDDAFALLKKARHEIAQMASDPDGYTIGVNEGEAAGRTVDHLHIHVIPRRKGDVDDPRGDIRRIFPHCNPDAWAPAR